VNRLTFVEVVVLLLLGATSSESQTIADYNTHLSALDKNALEWRAQVQVVDPAKIVVPYHIGKLIEENRKALLQNIDLISLYSTHVPSTRQLSAKIDLMVLVKEVRQDMDDLVLLEMVSSDQKSAVTWGTTIGNMANGPVSIEEQYQIKTVDKFANDLEARCGMPK
jgi:hypothetical protein